MLKKFHWRNLFIYSMAAIVLAGCSSSSWRYPRPQPSEAVKGAAVGTVGGALVGTVTGVGPTAGAVIGGVSGGIIGAHLAKNQTLVQRLTANKVQIILVGDNFKLILPSERFFAPNTPVLNENYYPVLNQIALLLKGLDKYVITISGYTDNTGWPDRNLALSRQQAQVIANYLWNRGIDARVLYATGYGMQNPIAGNDTPMGRAMNNRIEITFREITDDRDQ